MAKASASDPADVQLDPAFESFFMQHWAGVYRVLFRLTGSHADAEDLALETFVRFWQSPPKNLSSPGGWLYRVALNLGYNALRSARRRVQYELETGKGDLQGTASVWPAETVELWTERSDERRRVRAALAKMDSRQARLLVLRQSGLSYAEIAQATGLSPASIGALLVRAEKAFLQIYEKDDDHDSHSQ